MTKHIHFIGIGGIGTSSLAQIFHEKGKKISGSDIAPSQITKTLNRKGIKVTIGHKKENINKTHQLIIYSPAIPKSNPELKQAKKLKIRTISYPQALGELSKDYFTIAVSGTHGKSTTTAMTALAIKELDPTVVIGTKLKEFKNRNFKVGKGKYLILEACEYKRSFLNLHPDILVITNIEAEHLDYFKDLSDYKKAFSQLAKRVSKNGTIIINEKDRHSRDIVKDAKAKILSWNKIYNKKLKIPGDFNKQNATFAEQTAKLLGIKDSTINKALRSYEGSWRRMQYKRKKLGNLKFIDDYAHHPTEIKLTLAAIREKHPTARILTIFQPHQYSRTKLLLEQFADSFHDTDEVIIPNIYQVRDTQSDLKAVSVDDLVKEIKKHTKAKNGHSLEKTAIFIKANHKNYDLIITMGAGDINEIYKYL